MAGTFTAIGGHHSARAKTDVWLTPPELLQALGGSASFDLDPCAPEVQPWPTAQKRYTQSDNGLMREWFGRVWLNPPYRTDLIRRFMARMADHGHGLALIFARTETEHFAKFIWPKCDALLFLEGRLHFHHANGTRARKNAGAPSVLCAYGPDDADVLAGCGLAGAFVPLRLRAFVYGLSNEQTWRDVIQDWMAKQKGPAHLSELYRAFATHPKAQRNRNYQAKIRQVLQRGPFERVEKGLWTYEGEGNG